MPKMRGIKPETWTDDKIVELSPLARLLFIGMWNYACDNGHIENKPKQLKLRILPADACDVTELITELITVGCVVQKKTHLSIPTLPQHQRIDRRYFTSCDHCEPDEVPARHDGHTTGTRSKPTGDTTGSRVEGRKEGEGSEGEGEGNPHPRGAANDDADPAFDAFWSVYPRKKEKRDGVKAYRSALRRTSPDRILEALERDKRTTWAQRAPEFIPYPASWLNGDPWDDEPDEPVQPVRHLQRVEDIEEPPDGLNPAEYREWYIAQHSKRGGS